MKMEEDIDLRELIKAIQKGDKERAERIAVTLFKRPNPTPLKKTDNPHSKSEWIPIVLGILGTVGIIALSALEMWFSHKQKQKKEKVEVEYV